MYQASRHMGDLMNDADWVRAEAGYFAEPEEYDDDTPCVICGAPLSEHLNEDHPYEPDDGLEDDLYMEIFVD